MTNAPRQDETLVEYFKEMVEGALARQRVEPTQSTSPTAFYVVRLLTVFARADVSTQACWNPEPFAVRLGRALETAGRDQRAQLREIGDSSLFLVGFFGDSLHRKIVEPEYYMSLGEYAYGSLSQCEADILAPVFAELAQRFLTYVDVLHEVSQRTALSSDSDLLKLYERWLRTGSTLSQQLLAERGIAPVAAGSRFVQ
ncbi:MAG: hypothetical protein GEU99_08115 [Luteitalea sp.]|nr:hypothetical protein [Luteitalea sp.]